MLAQAVLQLLMLLLSQVKSQDTRCVVLAGDRDVVIVLGAPEVRHSYARQSILTYTLLLTNTYPFDP